MPLPILYSFRRCPYAMRARLALSYSGIGWEHREILLKDKPQEMLDASPKGTVPVLVLPDGNVIDESLDVMHWALEQSDPDGWLDGYDNDLIQKNDDPFKKALDRYKYPNRYPDEDCSGAYDECLDFMAILNQYINNNHETTLTDIAIFPFVRQFSKVDSEMFEKLDYSALKSWLNGHLKSGLFIKTMEKKPLWKKG